MDKHSITSSSRTAVAPRAASLSVSRFHLSLIPPILNNIVSVRGMEDASTSKKRIVFPDGLLFVNPAELTARRLRAIGLIQKQMGRKPEGTYGRNGRLQLLSSLVRTSRSLTVRSFRKTFTE